MDLHLKYWNLENKVKIRFNFQHLCFCWPQFLERRMSHMATNKVKENFYCTSHFRLFVLVSFMCYSACQQQNILCCTFTLQAFLLLRVKRRDYCSLGAIFNTSIEYFIGIDYEPAMTSKASGKTFGARVISKIAPFFLNSLLGLRNVDVWSFTMFIYLFIIYV